MIPTQSDTGPLICAYPLAFDVVSTVVLGARSVSYADSNFGVVPTAGLTPGELARIAAVQRELELFDTLGSRWRRRLSRLLGR